MTTDSPDAAVFRLADLNWQPRTQTPQPSSSSSRELPDDALMLITRDGDRFIAYGLAPISRDFGVLIRISSLVGAKDAIDRFIRKFGDVSNARFNDLSVMHADGHTVLGGCVISQFNSCLSNVDSSHPSGSAAVLDGVEMLATSFQHSTSHVPFRR